MNKFGKLVLGGLICTSFGLTSCVNDEISDEVKAIYENQAAFLAAQTSLIQAEASLEDAKVAYQLLLNKSQEAKNAAEAAQNALAVLNAENALELAKEEHLKALLQLKLEVEATKSQEAEKYLGKFLTETGSIIALEADLESQKRDLASLKAAVIDGVFDKEEALELKNLEIAELESQLIDDEAKLEKLKAVVSEPTSIGAQVIALQKQIDDLKAANKERNARINEIQTTELAALGDNISDYQQAKLDVQTEKNAVQANEIALNQANEDLTEAQNELNELTGGTTITFDQAIQNKRDAEVLKDEKEAIYNDVLTLASDYNEVIDEIASISEQIEQTKTSIFNSERALSFLQSNYDEKKAIFDANPSGITITGAGADGIAGNHDDNSSFTYRLVLNTNSNPISYGNLVYFNSASLPAGARISSVPINGRYFNVEADDITITNSQALKGAQVSLVNTQSSLSNLKAKLIEDEAKLVELQEKATEFDTTLNTQLETARAERDNAINALNLASDIVAQIEAITSLENSVLDTEKRFEEAKQKLNNVEKELTRLETLVDDEKLAEHIALLDRIDELNLEISLDQKTIANLQGDIAYFEGLELELEASNYSGSDYEERMEKIANEIKAQEASILETEKNIAKAKNDLENISQDKLNLEEERVAEIAEIEALIEKTETEIAQRKTLAESFKKLMEDALAS